MNPYFKSTRTVCTARECREVIQEFKKEIAKESIQERFIEIDNLRKAKSEILKGDSSPIVKGYLANDIESRIQALKCEINEIVSSY